MDVKNNDKSSKKITALEDDFSVLRIRNDLDLPKTVQHPVDQEFIQFHFCSKGQMNFSFNQGNYSFPLSDGNSMLLFNPQKTLPIDLEMAPQTWLVSILISVTRFHSLFSSEADHISFLSPENSSKKYYDTLPFKSSIAVVLSQILQAKVHDSMKELYFKGKVYELLSLYFNKSEDPSLEQCPFLVDEENVQKIRRAKDIILERMTDPPSLENLSVEIGLSLKKLKEGFKQVYGASVYVFLLDYKMQVSKRLLSSGNYNVNEVALKVGYSTATHFINAFKKKFGTTPKKYLMSL